MRKLTLALILGLVCTTTGWAQQSAADAPATKEDIQRYLDAMHSREMMANMVTSLSKPMHDMIHDQFEKDKDRLPADFEAQMDKMLDDSLKTFPWDEMLDAMIPVYQKHFTKGDVNALVAFYDSPTGKKMIRDLPAIMQESMRAMMPIMQKQMDAIREREEQEVADMLKHSATVTGEKP